MISKFSSYLSTLKSTLQTSPYFNRSVRKFIRHNRRVWKEFDCDEGGPVVLVDRFPAAETIITFSFFANVLAKRSGATLVSFTTHRSWATRFRDHGFAAIFRSFNTKSHIAPVLSQQQETLARTELDRIFPTLKTKKDLFDLTFRDVTVGVDIYESYLRPGRPTVDFNDPQLRESILLGLRLVIFWEHYFQQNDVVGVIISHDCYLEFNTVAKMGYKFGAPVYLPNVRGAALSTQPFSIYEYFPRFREMFRKLPVDEQQAGKAWAKAQLEAHFEGRIGSNIHYAQKSAFGGESTSRVLRESSNTKVLIATHCFFDNPHPYKPFPFTDISEWLEFLGQLSEKTSYDWYVKPHADYEPGTNEKLIDIFAKYPNVTLLPSDTDAKDMIRDGLDFVLTGHGSVGYEYPYFGVQVINGSYNSRIDYDFNWHATSNEHFEELVLNLEQLDKKASKEEIYEYYFMCFNYVVADEFIFPSYRQMVTDLSYTNRLGPAVYDYFLSSFSEKKFDETIGKMELYISSGKHFFFSRGPE